MAGKQKSTPKAQIQTQPEVQSSNWLPWLSLALPILGGLYLHFSDYFELRVDKQIDTKLQQSVEKIDTKVQTTNDKLDALGQRVSRIEGKLEGLKLQSLSIQPNKRVNAMQASEILNTAKKEGTRIDPKVITVAGQEFISAGVGSSDTDVWKTGLAFLDYRSFLNSALAPPTDKFKPRARQPLPWKFQLPLGALKPDEVGGLRTGETVPAERAAVFETIGSRLNVDEKVGFEFLLIRVSSIKLDGYRLKSIVFTDTKIIYEAGRVEMENVYFVNCTFEISKRANGKNFASSVLASEPATTFHAEG
jgi:hypothetical protein